MESSYLIFLHIYCFWFDKVIFFQKYIHYLPKNIKSFSWFSFELILFEHVKLIEYPIIR